MPIYNFNSQFTFTNFTPGPKSMGGALEFSKDIDFYPPSSTQLYDNQGQSNIFGDSDQTSTEFMQEFSEPGFRYLDNAMKLYWSDVRIPVRDIVKFMKVKIAGSNKSIQIWIDDLKHGRVKLPVMSINRTSHQYNPDKFSYPYHPMAIRYMNNQRTRISKTLRPVPYLVDYTLTIWAEHKWDVEHAIFQIMPRFNPLAEFRASDGHVVGNVQLRFGGMVDNSDKEASAEQLAKIKYELTCTAEAWLSLPEQIVPSVISTYTNYKLGSELIPGERIRIGATNG